MKNYLEIIHRSSLFNGLMDTELNKLLNCLNAKTETFIKGQFILRVGDTPDSVGLVLSGNALIMQEDFWGNRNILTKITPSGLFAEAFACSPETIMNLSVIAENNCSVVWLKINRILSTCPTACPYHIKIIHNLLSELADKNLRLNERMTHMGQRTTQQKILSYLSLQAQKNASSSFDIIFNRQQLADYLSVERSALSAELCKLRDNGMIEFKKNHFELKQILKYN